MDEEFRKLVDSAFDEFIKDFTDHVIDIDKDINNYAARFFDDRTAQHLFAMEVELQLFTYQVSKYLAVFPPSEQFAMIDKMETRFRKGANNMHQQWLQHQSKYRKEKD